MNGGAARGQGAKRVLQEPLNSHRLLVDAVKAAAKARGLGFESHSQGWILELTQGDQRRTIYGYDFGLNRSATFQLMKDTAGFADACLRRGIPAVPHRVFCIRACKAMCQEFLLEFLQQLIKRLEVKQIVEYLQMVLQNLILLEIK